MLKKIVVLSLLVFMLAMSAGGAAAQEDTTGGQVRVVQIFYEAADVYVDNALVVSGLDFTVGTDFIAVEPGTHSIALTQANSGLGAATSIDLEVEAGHIYTIITMGEYETGAPTLMTINETDTFAEYDPLGNNALIVQNVPGAIPVDLWFVDELKIENLTYGTFGSASAPLGEFTAQAVMAGEPDAVLFESHYFAVPGTVSLAYLSGTFPDKINRTFFTTTASPMFDYLTAHASVENSQLTTLYDLMVTAGLQEMLNSEEQYTLFAPTNAAFDALSPDLLESLRSNPAALGELLRSHLVTGRWGPYQLQGEHSLASVQGTPLEIRFDPVDLPLTVNGIETGLQHRTANGIIYLIDNVLAPPIENPS